MWSSAQMVQEADGVQCHEWLAKKVEELYHDSH